MIRAPNAPSVAVAPPGSRISARDTALERRRLMARIAWLVIAALVIAVVVAMVPVRYSTLLHTGGTGIPPTLYAAYEIGLFLVAMLVFEAVAAVLVWHPLSGRTALLSALALVTFPVYGSSQDRIAHLALPLHWTGVCLAFIGVSAFALAMYVVPDGRFNPFWTRWLIVPWIAIQAAHQFLVGTSWDYIQWPPLLAVAAVACGLGPAIAVMLYRYHRVFTPTQRREAAWLIWAVVLAVAIVLVTELVVKVLPSATQQSLAVRAAADTARVGAALLVPIGIALAIARHRLWAIDPVIHRTLVYGLLTATVIGFYVLVVGTLSTALSGHASVLVSLVATGLVALLFQPLRERLQRSVNHLMYGDRDDPYQLLSRLGQRLEETLAPDEVLPAIVETVARALKLPYVAISLPRDGGSVFVAVHGTPVPAPLVLPLVYQQELVGKLLVAPRAGTDSLGPADWRLFADLTRQTAVAVHASQLTARALRLSAEVQHAHTRLVTLREEERRRLRRDLHDGLGPVLASVTLQAENARDLIQIDPVQADAVLADLTTQAQAAIADIRRVVYDLRPPTLDDLGLIDAVRIHADRLSGQTFSINVELQGELPALPAAVEVAAYRIIQEALTNVVRHSQASNCTVCLGLTEMSTGDALVLEVIDDGCGLPADWRPGMGMHSMRVRAAELCGSSFVGERNSRERGTRVCATLPLACSEVDDMVTEDW